MTHHRHTVSTTRTLPWTGCVAKPERCCSGAAHGNIIDEDRCACGATRKTEINGRHVERGPWIVPDLAKVSR